MKGMRELGLLLMFCAALCSASEANVSPESLTVVRDANGIAYTDFLMKHRTWGPITRTPTVRLETEPNAKAACETLGGRLPKLSEVNNLAIFMNTHFFEYKTNADTKLLKTKFMTDDRYFWTAKIRTGSGPHVKERAVATLFGLKTSTDKTRARIQWVGTHLDATEYRPFLCVFDPLVQK